MKVLELVQRALVISIIFLPVWSFGGAGIFVPFWVLGLGLALCVLAGLDNRGVLGGRRRASLLVVEPSLFYGLVVGAVWAAMAAWNARADFDPADFSFLPREFVGFLPTSFDPTRSWRAALNSIAGATAFLGLTLFLAKDRSSTNWKGGGRIAFFCWMLVCNGLVLALVGVVGRLDDPDKLLWVLDMPKNFSSEVAFGPFRYRGSAATTLNLIWPVLFGLWWTGSWGRRSGWSRDPSLLVYICILVAAVVMTGSRGGWMICGAQLLAVGAWFGLRGRFSTLGVVSWKFTLIGVLVLGGITIGSLDWGYVKDRIADGDTSFKLRVGHWAQTIPMIEDYPVFGVGPGAYDVAFAAYDQSENTRYIWVRNAHSDPIQTVATYGVLGSVLMWGFVVRWFLRLRPFVNTASAMVFIAVCGAVVHSSMDLPFQLFGTQLMILEVCALASIACFHPSPTKSDSA